MEMTNLCKEVLDVVENFDRLAAPYGHYSTRDLLLLPKPKEALEKFIEYGNSHPESSTPYELTKLLARPNNWNTFNATHYEWEDGDWGLIWLKVVRTSKIKVRQFGSKYHVDKNEQFPDRWKALEVDDLVSELWTTIRSDVSSVRMLLLLGFDRATLPLEKEMGSLRTWDKLSGHGVEHFSRSWTDPHRRGFHTRAALWARPSLAVKNN